MKRSLCIFWGKVRKGKDRGKALGFPTANIALHRKIPAGVYVSKTKVKGLPAGRQNVWHPSLTFIGAAKTFGESKIQAETYILESPRMVARQRSRLLRGGIAWRIGSLHDQYLTIRLIKKIRGNKKFSSAAKLVDQMKEDEKEARKYFS